MTIPKLHQLFSTHKASELYGRYISLNCITPLIEDINKSVDISIMGHSVNNNPIHKITVGKGFGKMIRFKSQSEKPAARIHQLTLGANGRWSENKVEARIE